MRTMVDPAKKAPPCESSAWTGFFCFHRKGQEHVNV
jgi:hypothetical protein